MTDIFDASKIKTNYHFEKEFTRQMICPIIVALLYLVPNIYILIAFNFFAKIAEISFGLPNIGCIFFIIISIMYKIKGLYVCLEIFLLLLFGIGEITLIVSFILFFTSQKLIDELIENAINDYPDKYGNKSKGKLEHSFKLEVVLLLFSFTIVGGACMVGIELYRKKFSQKNFSLPSISGTGLLPSNE